MRPASQTRAVWSAIIGLPLLFTGIAMVQTRIDARTRTVSRQKEDLLLRSPAAIKKMSLGYNSLLADIYWTRTVQYYGERVGTPNVTFELLWPLLDITTTLDPKLIPAYRFGAIFLSEPGTAGAGRSDLAIELVKRGIAANPDQWNLYTDMGFLYYWRMKDYPDSAAAYLEGSKNPNAPAWVKMMAARIAGKGGSLETSAMMWSEIYDSTQDPRIRNRAKAMLSGIKAENDILHLNEIAEEYQKRIGHSPSSSEEMRKAGLLNGIPVDPNGFAYVFGQDGKARLDPHSTVVDPLSLKTAPAEPK